MKKPVMLHVITNFAGVGGAEMMLSRLIQATEHEYSHVIISLMQTSEVYQTTLARCQQVSALGWNGLNTARVLKQLRQQIQGLAPEVVQTWMYHANVLTSLSVLALKQKPRIVWGIHHSLAAPQDESLSTKIALFASKYLSKQPAAIVYCAHSSLQQHQAFGFKNSQQQVIANGVFMQAFQTHAELHTPLTIGFAGRYHPAKGYAYLFACMALLKQHDIIFKIAGSGASFANPEIQALFDQYQLDATKVELLDQVNDMPAFYQSVDVFLMSSITEGFPNVLVEAMASGLPCISTDVGDAAFIVQDLGEIVAARDPDALAQAILNYAAKSTAEKLSLKQQCRQRVEQHFSIDSVSQHYLQLWRALV